MKKVSKKAAAAALTEKLKEWLPMGDKEIRHSEADKAVLEYLRVVSPEAAEIYHEITENSWYA